MAWARRWQGCGWQARCTASAVLCHPPRAAAFETPHYSRGGTWPGMPGWVWTSLVRSSLPPLLGLPEGWPGTGKRRARTWGIAPFCHILLVKAATGQSPSRWKGKRDAEEESLHSGGRKRVPLPGVSNTRGSHWASSTEPRPRHSTGSTPTPSLSPAAGSHSASSNSSLPWAPALHPPAEIMKGQLRVPSGQSAVACPGMRGGWNQSLGRGREPVFHHLPGPF